MSSVTDYLNNLEAQRDALAANLSARGQSASNTELLDTLVPKVLNLKPANYVQGVEYYVTSLTFSGTYATSTYFVESNCSCYRDAAGRIALVMQSGTSTTYENLYFTLTDSSGLGVTLTGQSIYNYASASSGQFYVAVLSGITKPVKLAVAMDSRNSSSDYVTCAITVTLA